MESFENEQNELVTTVNLGRVVGPAGPAGADGIPGEPGPKGDPFKIKKTYESIEAMQSDDTDDVAEGDMVIINTDDVEDPDNAKLYVKTADDWGFITDLSGAQGIKGETGPKGATGAAGKDGAFANWPAVETFDMYFAGVRVGSTLYNDQALLLNQSVSISGSFYDKSTSSTPSTSQKTLNGVKMQAVKICYKSYYYSGNWFYSTDLILPRRLMVTLSGSSVKSISATSFDLIFFADRSNSANLYQLLNSLKLGYIEMNTYSTESDKLDITHDPNGNSEVPSEADYVMYKISVTLKKNLNTFTNGTGPEIQLYSF